MSTSYLTLVRHVALTLALLVPAPSAQSQTFPVRPVHLVLGLPAGGGADVIARVVAQGLSEELRQPVVVENRPGASGLIAADMVAKAAPDGYTLLLGGMGLVLAAAFGKPLPVDFERDLTPVSSVANVPTVLVVGAVSPFRTGSDLINYAKAHPGDLNYASAGNGSALHLFMELFSMRSGIRATHVPYKGGVQAGPDLIKGDIHAMFEILPTQIANIRAGKVRALGIMSVRRNSQLPEVPTLAELGVPDLDVGVWYALYAPARTPKEAIDALQAALRSVLESKPLRERLVQLGAEAAPGTAAGLAEFQRREKERWAQVIRSSGAVSDGAGPLVVAERRIERTVADGGLYAQVNVARAAAIAASARKRYRILTIRSSRRWSRRH